MEELEARLFKNWWLLLLKGIIISLFGVVFILADYIHLLSKFPNYKVLVYTFICLTMVNGALILFGTIYYKKNNSHWIFWLIEGAYDLLLGLTGIIGIIIIEAVKTHILNMFLIQIISVWAFIHGILHFFSALRLRNYVPNSRYALYSALVVCIMSFILFFKPLISASYDNQYVGTFLIVIGILLSAISIILRRIYSD